MRTMKAVVARDVFVMGSTSGLVGTGSRSAGARSDSHGTVSSRSVHDEQAGYHDNQQRLDWSKRGRMWVST